MCQDQMFAAQSDESWRCDHSRSEWSWYDAQAAWSNDWTDPSSSDGHPPAEQLAGLQPAELDHESIREALQVSRWLKQRSIGCATKMNWQKAQRLLRRCDVTVVLVKSRGPERMLDLWQSESLCFQLFGKRSFEVWRVS